MQTVTGRPSSWKTWCEASACYEKALELDHENLAALSYRADSLLEDMLYEEALVYYKRILELEPSNLGALVHSGDLLFMKELYDEALLCYEKALDVDPDNEWVMVNRKRVLDQR